jgi:hypothetical protein
MIIDFGSEIFAAAQHSKVMGEMGECRVYILKEVTHLLFH